MRTACFSFQRLEPTGEEDMRYMPWKLQVMDLVQQSKILTICHMPMLPSTENGNGYDEIPRGALFSTAQAPQLPHPVRSAQRGYKT